MCFKKPGQNSPDFRTKNVCALLEKNYRIHCSMNNKASLNLNIDYMSKREILF